MKLKNLFKAMVVAGAVAGVSACSQMQTAENTVEKKAEEKVQQVKIVKLLLRAFGHRYTRRQQLDVWCHIEGEGEVATYRFQNCCLGYRQLLAARLVALLGNSET